MPRKTKGMKGLREVPEGSGNWYWYPYDKNRSPKRKCVNLRATNQESAIEEASGLRMKWIRGEFDPWLHEYKGDRPLPQLVKDFLHHFRHQSANTLTNKRSVLKLMLAALPTSHAPSVTDEHIEAFVVNSSEAESTRTNRVTITQQFFDYLIDEGVIKQNPAKRYGRRRRQTLSKAKRQESTRRRQYMFMPQEVKRLADAARLDSTPQAQRQYFGDVIEFAACTGLRKSEVAHLCWRDVMRGANGAAGRLFVRCWKTEHEEFTTKYGRDRTVPLFPRADEIIGRQSRISEDGYEPVFKRPTSPEGVASAGWQDWRLVPGVMTTHFDFVRGELKITDRDAVFHALRHTFISWMVMLRVDDHLLRKWTGHASIDVFSGYIHLTEPYMLGNARAVQRELVEYLCPGASDAVLKAVLPDVEQALGDLSAYRPHIPIEDALVGGIFYRPDLVA